MQVGLSLGPSFAELCVTSTRGSSSFFFRKRAYLPKENLATCFQKLRDFMSSQPDGKIEKLVVSCRYLEKIFETKLGGSVAQVVTAGFENWPALRQPINPQYFSSHPLRVEPLASQEHIFGIPERIDANGNVLKALTTSALEPISAKLKLMEIKKVCVNLLFAGKNDSHETLVKDYFVEQGFEVYCTSRDSSSRDEVSAWRGHILNACLSGTFTEILGEIQKATSGLLNPENIFFLDSLGELHQKPLNHLSSVLFGWTSQLPKDTKEPWVLNLGLETWSLSSLDSKKSWQSPWGAVEVPHRRTVSLKVQPTQEIESDLWGELSISARPATYEPGPMSWGRARKPLVVDVLFSQCPELTKEFESLIIPAGVQRYIDTLKILQRNSSLASLEISQLEKSLIERILLGIEMEIPVSSVLVTGLFASSLVPRLRAQCPQINWKITENSSYWEAEHAAQV
jgi:N-methylhydantoinase A